MEAGDREEKEGGRQEVWTYVCICMEDGWRNVQVCWVQTNVRNHRGAPNGVKKIFRGCSIAHRHKHLTMDAANLCLEVFCILMLFFPLFFFFVISLCANLLDISV